MNRRVAELGPSRSSHRSRRHGDRMQAMARHGHDVAVRPLGARRAIDEGFATVARAKRVDAKPPPAHP